MLTLKIPTHTKEQLTTYACFSRNLLGHRATDFKLQQRFFLIRCLQTFTLSNQKVYKSRNL